MKTFRTYLLTLIVLIACSQSATAQCTFNNTAFKSGEFLSYNLYYNWKFVWVKAGSASMSTVRDTLLCYCSEDLAPLYFRKGAREGKHYTVDEVFYTYSGDKCNLRQHRQHNSGEHSWKKTSYDDCIYDMLNIFLRARSFNPEGWKKGHIVKIPIADGTDVINAILKYTGTTNIKADNGVKYRCLQLSYMEQEKGKYKEIVRFYVTDDQNHIPVRLDMFLRFGSAKAFLTGMKGNRNPLESVVK